MSYLWKAYPLAPQVLEEVKQHLRDNNFLTQDDKWNPVKATAEQFRTQGSGREIETFAFFSDLMNAILVSLRNAGRKTFVKMVNAGNFKPESDMINSSKPDAFLCVDTGSTSNQKKFKWRDLTCPIEYEFGKGDRVDVSELSLPLTLISSKVGFVTPITERQQGLVEPQPHHALRPVSNVLVWVHSVWNRVSNLVVVSGGTFHL